MDGIEIKLIDREAILYLVQGLEDFEKDKALRSGLAAAAQVFKAGGIRRLKQRMKKPTGVKGNLLRAFTVRVKKSKPGALAGFETGKGGGGHSWWLDKGTKERYIKTKGNKYAGAGPALRYWEDTRNQDYPKAIDKLREGTERAVQRLKKIK